MTDDPVQDESRAKENSEEQEELQKKEGNSDSANEKSQKKESQNNDGSIHYNDDIVIFPDQPLPHLNRGPVRAYAAKGKRKVPEDIFVLLVQDELTPRSRMAGKYASIINPSLAKLIASGPVYWAPEKRQRYVFIYESNLGEPIVKNDLSGFLGLNQDLVLKAIIRPMIGALVDLRNKDVVHGAIRPSNIFTSGHDNFDRVVLGECLCLPPSYDMPVLYETIERAMADPAGRGIGTPDDDLYSFGVSLAFLLRTSDPMDGFSDHDIIKEKIENGTYAALTGKDRFTGAVLELLRGLLHDDTAQRWTLEEVDAWMDGRRLSPKQAKKKTKATRPIIFQDNKYLRPELFAYDLPQDVTEAAHIIENGDLDQWMDRALEDKLVQSRVEQARQMMSDQSQGAAFQENLVTRVSIALDPPAPIRYKELRMMPYGVGTALTHAFIKKEDLTPFVDTFIQSFVMQWVGMQGNAAVDSSALNARFDSCRTFVRQTNIGYGIERCIYFLNPECPCLSEKLADYYVRSPEDLMNAYEDMSSNPKKPIMFFDRHVVAFLSVKDRKNIDPYLGELNAEEKYKKILAEIKTLATIQKRSRLDKFPGIANWISENLDPVYERFHDREARKKMHKKIENVKESGDITKIAALFDNAELYQHDTGTFYEAMKEYAYLVHEKAKLEAKLEKGDSFGQGTGQQVAAVVSGILSGIVILISAFTALSKGGLGIF